MHKTHPCSITGNLASLPFTAVYVSSGVIKCTLPFHGIVHPLAFIAVSTGKSRFTITMFMVLRPVTCKVRGEELWQMWENAWNDDNELTKWWQRWRSGSTVDFRHFLSPRWVQDHTFATPGRGVTLHFYMVFRELIKLSHHANWRRRFHGVKRNNIENMFRVNNIQGWWKPCYNQSAQKKMVTMCTKWGILVTSHFTLDHFDLNRVYT